MVTVHFRLFNYDNLPSGFQNLLNVEIKALAVAQLYQKISKALTLSRKSLQTQTPNSRQNDSSSLLIDHFGIT